MNTNLPLAPRILQWWREAGGEAVSFGSDAHEPDRLAREFHHTAARSPLTASAPGRPHISSGDEDEDEPRAGGPVRICRASLVPLLCQDRRFVTGLSGQQRAAAAAVRAAFRLVTSLLVLARRARDSNPRGRSGYRPNGFQDRLHRPLGQPSSVRHPFCTGRPRACRSPDHRHPHQAESGSSERLIKAGDDTVCDALGAAIMTVRCEEEPTMVDGGARTSPSCIYTVMAWSPEGKGVRVEPNTLVT